MARVYESYFANKRAPDVIAFAHRHVDDWNFQTDRQKRTAIEKAVRQKISLATAIEWFKDKPRTKGDNQTPETPVSDDEEEGIEINTEPAGAIPPSASTPNSSYQSLPSSLALRIRTTQMTLREKKVKPYDYPDIEAADLETEIAALEAEAMRINPAEVAAMRAEAAEADRFEAMRMSME